MESIKTETIVEGIKMETEKKGEKEKIEKKEKSLVEIKIIEENEKNAKKLKEKLVV